MCVYIYIYIYSFWYSFHYGLLQGTEFISLCYTVGPGCLSISHIVVCMKKVFQCKKKYLEREHF